VPVILTGLSLGLVNGRSVYLLKLCDSAAAIEICITVISELMQEPVFDFPVAIETVPSPDTLFPSVWMQRRALE
jgi:hypothetical protein